MFSDDQIFQIIFNVTGFFVVRALARMQIIRNEWVEMKNKQIILEQSLKKAWEYIDKLKAGK